MGYVGEFEPISRQRNGGFSATKGGKPVERYYLTKKIFVCYNLKK